MQTYDFHHGASPLLISIPHAGTAVPETIRERFTAVGETLPDTDWYVDRLYAFAREMDVSIITANFSRYVVDLNRAPDSASLYPANSTSPVCPLFTFDGQPIWLEGGAPGAAEVESRVRDYWRPYHETIETVLNRLKARHGFALLWDAHSIVSEVPALFAGVLPDFNFGTRDDAACPRTVAESLLELVTSDGKFGAVLNGRFKGGYITDHYGRPDEDIYAIQLEVAQRVYMEEPRGAWDTQRAHGAIEWLRRLLRQYVAASI